MGLRKILLAVVLPWIVFFSCVPLMEALSGRVFEFDAPVGWCPPSYADNYPLNRRITGYSASQAEIYWREISQQQPEIDGKQQKAGEQLVAEEAILKIDLLFPIFYGGAFLLALLFVRRQLKSPSPLVTLLLVSPVAITCLADWTENLIQLSQLSRYNDQSTLDAAAIQVASIATQVKTVAFLSSGLLLLVLGIQAALALRR